VFEGFDAVETADVEAVTSVSGFVDTNDVVVPAAGSSSRSESEMSSISFIIRELLCFITVVETDLVLFGNFLLVPNLGS
jgi:hypothetical protein